MPKLEKLLAAEDGSVRCQTLAALIRIQGKLSELTRARISVCAANEVDSFCVNIIEALQSAKNETPDLLWDMFLQSKSDTVRMRAIAVIGKCGKRSIGFQGRLVSILLDPKMKDEIRECAAFAIGEVEGCGEAEVKILIMIMLSDRSPSVRHSSCYALGRFPQFAKRIRPVIQQFRLQEENNHFVADTVLDQLPRRRKSARQAKRVTTGNGKGAKKGTQRERSCSAENLWQS